MSVGHDVSASEAIERSREGNMQCQCGKLTGYECSAEATTVLYYMPEDLRNGHREASRGGGGPGRYPANGAWQLDLSSECADVLRHSHHAQDGWVSESPMFSRDAVLKRGT